MVSRFDGKLLSKVSEVHNWHVYVVCLAAGGYRMILHVRNTADKWWDYREFQTVRNAFQVWDPLVDSQPVDWYRSSDMRIE